MAKKLLSTRVREAIGALFAVFVIFAMFVLGAAVFDWNIPGINSIISVLGLE